MKLTPDNLTQLQELMNLETKELHNLKQLSIRYFGPSSVDVKLITLELRRRRRIKPPLHPVIGALKQKANRIKAEVERLYSLRFNPMVTLYHKTTLKPYTSRTRHDPNGVLTGRMAYRVACERIDQLEVELVQLDAHIGILQRIGKVTEITLDILEGYGIQPELYKKELEDRLNQLKCRVLPNTVILLPTFHRYIPQPLPGQGPLPGDYLECARNKNFREGAYKIIIGGVGWNRYYCRKLLEILEPDHGYRLFVSNYSSGYGHYIIAVPESQCYNKALNYIFTKEKGKPAYYGRRAVQRSKVGNRLLRATGLGLE